MSVIFSILALFRKFSHCSHTSISWKILKLKPNSVIYFIFTLRIDIAF